MKGGSEMSRPLTKDEVEYWYVKVHAKGGVEYTAMTQPIDKYAERATECWKFSDREDAESWVMCDLSMSRLVRVRSSSDRSASMFINMDMVEKIVFLPFKKVWRGDEE